MIYLTIFWCSFIVFFVIYFIGRFFAIKQIGLFTEHYGVLVFIVLTSFAIMAIVTKDPSVGELSIPTDVPC